MQEIIIKILLTAVVLFWMGWLGLMMVGNNDTKISNVFAGVIGITLIIMFGSLFSLIWVI